MPCSCCSRRICASSSFSSFSSSNLRSLSASSAWVLRVCVAMSASACSFSISGLALELGEPGIGRRRDRRRARIVRVGRRAGRGEEQVDVLVAGEPGELARCVVEVLRADQAGGDRLLLRGDDHVEVGELLALAAGAEPDIDGQVVARLPVARIDRDPAVAQAHGLAAAAVPADGRVQQREQVADAGLGKDARDQLGPRLRGVEHLVGDGGDLVLQRVGIEPLPLAAHAGAPFARGVLVLQQRKDMAADVGMADDAEPARHLCAHDAARARDQEVVERGLGGVALRHLGARIVGEVGVVEQRPQQRGLDALDVHHEVGDRAAEEAVGDDHRRHRRERNGLLADDVGRAVAQQDLPPAVVTRYKAGRPSPS